MISRQSGEPLFRQVADHLRQAIADGTLRPGQPLPSERSLQQEFEVSRDTIRRAVALLRAEGKIVVRHGEGMAVRDEPQLEQITAPADSTVIARMPTADERVRLDIGDGVPVLVVTDPDGQVRVYAGDQYCLRVQQN